MERLEELTSQLQRRLFVELEASARHVHVTQAQAMALFGHDLTPLRPLSQPGQFLAEERVTLEGPKGKIDRVAVLGPCRSAGQAELSATDAVALGIRAPVRLSGDVHGSAAITLVGVQGRVTLSEGAIIAQRHVHMTPEDAALQGVADGMLVRLRTLTGRPVIFEQVAVRISPEFRTYAHLDFDEANACGFQKGEFGMILP